MPNYEIGEYDSGPSSVIGCYSGPNGGLTTVRRTEKHLSILDNDIDFIDTYEEDTSKHLYTYFIFTQVQNFYIIKAFLKNNLNPISLNLSSCYEKYCVFWNKWLNRILIIINICAKTFIVKY